MHSPHVYSKVISVLPEHIDELQHVNNVQYLHWILPLSIGKAGHQSI